MFRPAGYPAHRSAGSWVFDVLVTLVAAVSAGPSTVHDSPHPQIAVTVVLGLSALPLLVRRIWPVPVFGVVLVLNAATGLWGHVHAVNGLALIIALYTVAAMRPRRDALVCAGLLELIAVIGLLPFAARAGGPDQHPQARRGGGPGRRAAGVPARRAARRHRR
jgi:hypothetical protein